MLQVWSFPSCSLLRSIDAEHAVNCVSVHGRLIASCSRTGRANGVANVILWDMDTGQAVRRMEHVASTCYVKVRSLKWEDDTNLLYFLFTVGPDFCTSS